MWLWMRCDSKCVQGTLSTAWISWFQSVGYSVGKIVLQKFTSPHRCNFPNKLCRLSAIRSVSIDITLPSLYTDRIVNGVIPSVYTDRVGDGIISLGKNYRWKNSVSNSVGFCRFSSSGSKGRIKRYELLQLLFWFGTTRPLQQAGIP